jgi:hypothetical protein
MFFCVRALLATTGSVYDDVHAIVYPPMRAMGLNSWYNWDVMTIHP